MLRETLKKELDKLNDDQLKKIADYMTSLEPSPIPSPALPETEVTSAEKAREFRQWILQLPRNAVSLPDEAFDRENIYAE
jgi:hypothetical protein